MRLFSDTGTFLNRHAERVGAVVMDAPFLDLLTCMTEPDLLLTEHEYEEWGDPRDHAAAVRMKSQCPYQGIPEDSRRLAFPPVLITYGCGDARVPEWGAFKWAARVRAGHVTDNDLNAFQKGADKGGIAGDSSLEGPQTPSMLFSTGAMPKLGALGHASGEGMSWGGRTRQPVVLVRRREDGHTPTAAHAPTHAAMVYAFLDKYVRL